MKKLLPLLFVCLVVGKTQAQSTELSASAMFTNSTGISLAKGTKILPNPFSSHFSIQLDEQLARLGTVKYTVMDYQGRVVYENRLVAENNVVEMNQQIPGAYILTVYTAEEQVAFKLLKTQ